MKPVELLRGIGERFHRRKSVSTEKAPFKPETTQDPEALCRERLMNLYTNSASLEAIGGFMSGLENFQTAIESFVETDKRTGINSGIAPILADNGRTSAQIFALQIEVWHNKVLSLVEASRRPVVEGIALREIQELLKEVLDGRAPRKNDNYYKGAEAVLKRVTHRLETNVGPTGNP